MPPALPHMREAGGGKVALIGWLAGRAAIPFQAHYSAAAVDALAMALYNEVRPFGIHVSLIEPGDINTPFNDAVTWWDGADSPYQTMIWTGRARAPSCRDLADAMQHVRMSLP